MNVEDVAPRFYSVIGEMIGQTTAALSVPLLLSIPWLPHPTLGQFPDIEQVVLWVNSFKDRSVPFRIVPISTQAYPFRLKFSHFETICAGGRPLRRRIITITIIMIMIIIMIMTIIVIIMIIQVMIIIIILVM